MTRSRTRSFNLKHALGLSTLLHAFVAPLFLMSGILVVGAGVSLEPAARGERFSIATLTVARAVVAPRPVVRERAPGPARIVAARAPHKAPSLNGAIRTGSHEAPVASSSRSSASTSAAPKTGAVAVVPTLAPQPAAAPPSAAPSAAVALTSAVVPSDRGGADGTVGGWGQSFEHPLVADDAALGELRSKYHFSAAVTISVDENGRAVKVNVPASVPNDARDEIARRLAALHYIPAECNGLRCAALLSITI